MMYTAQLLRTLAAPVTSHGNLTVALSGIIALHDLTNGFRPRVADFLNSLDPGSILLDVGCGNGI